MLFDILFPWFQLITLNLYHFQVKFSEKHLNIPRRDSAKLYLYLSIVIIFSRNIYCKLGDFKFFNRFSLFQFSAALAGVSFILLPYTTSYLHLVLFMVCIGFLDGGLWGLTALLVTDCAGVDSLNFAWGIFNLLAASGSAVGPPLAGKCWFWSWEFIKSIG